MNKDREIKRLNLVLRAADGWFAYYMIVMSITLLATNILCAWIFSRR